MKLPHRPSILIVDDEEDLRDLIADWLRGCGLEPIVAEGGEQALALLQRARPDLVVLDVMMPDVDGYELLRRIRRDPRLSYLPVILLTALSSPQQLVVGLEHGADDYISKPFSLDELRVRIEAHLRRSWRERQLDPLTLLPGNLAIEQELEDRLQLGTPLAVALVDLDNFKAYNDRYGFIDGDRVIQFLSSVLTEAVAQHSGEGSFVGRIGGDDFLAVVPLDRVEAVCQEVIRRFDAGIGDYYAPDDRARGHIEARNRRGEIERFPLVSVSIAVVVQQGHKLRHVAEVSHIAAQLKARLKALPGSNYLIDRRRSTAG